MKKQVQALKERVMKRYADRLFSTIRAIPKGLLDVEL